MTGDSTPTGEAAIDPAFAVEWDDPKLAELQWDRDDMHMPFALPPLALDYVETLTSGFERAYAYFGAPYRLHLRAIQGYCYYALDYGVPEADVKATFERVQEAYRAFGPKTTRYWNDEALPELRDIYAFIGSIDVDNLPADALAEAWQEAWRRLRGAWRIHFIAIRGAYRVGEDLADLYERAVPGAPAGEAPALIQGGNDVLQEVDAGIERLTELAAGLPDVAARLDVEPPPSLDELRALDGGPVFVAALEPFLVEHGHLGQNVDDLTQASWAEDPSLLLGAISRHLRNPPEKAAVRRARLQGEANRLAAAVRERLAERRDELRGFEATLQLAREIGPLTEVHNYWIDRMGQARIRTLSMRVARRLVREGVLEAPDDVFFLHVAEIADSLRNRRDRRALVTERRAELARQRELTPPAMLGKPEPDFGLSSRFDQVREEGARADDVMKGIGASAGTVRGPARVVLGREDFGRILAGDVIVCPSSNPSWVPVFTIAGGLVTNTGGVLSHAAVVAREFGLPAVVGVAGATTRIVDGRTIEIDGTAGTVRLL